MSGYEEIAKQMLAVNPNLIGDYIVKIWLDRKTLTTELVTITVDSDFEWLYDWWEGETVSLQDFIKLDDVTFNGECCKQTGGK